MNGGSRTRIMDVAVREYFVWKKASRAEIFYSTQIQVK